MLKSARITVVLLSRLLPFREAGEGLCYHSSIIMIIRLTAYSLLISFATTLLASPILAQSLPRGFLGVNTATWDPNLDTPRVATLLKAAGVHALRFPGGSTSDDFDWTKPGGTSTAQFGHLAAALHADATITTNYGDGSPQMAAAWVAYCNARSTNTLDLGTDASGRDWKTAGFWAHVRGDSPNPNGDDGLNHLRAHHPAPYNFRNWEIGNECFGSWENDVRTPKHDPSDYARFAIAAMTLMRKVDPKIRIGVVVTEPGKGVDCQESVLDPRTHQSTSEWTPIVLSALATHHVRPDFVAWHHYAQDPFKESDQGLLADTKQWPSIVGQLRAEIDEYFPTGPKVGIACTECNSVSFNPGPQTVSAVNATYYTQAANAALASGVESFYWWDLHNGPNHRKGEPAAAYGDYGILGSGDGQDVPYPVYEAMEAFAKAHSGSSPFGRRG